MFQSGFESPKFWHFELGNSKKPFFEKFEKKPFRGHSHDKLQNLL
jgi:hypothetical protein